MSTIRSIYCDCTTNTPPRLHSSQYVNNFYTITDFALGEEGRENASAFACSYAMQYLPYFDDG